MVVKAVRGRRRYVVFTVPDDTDREMIESAISSSGETLENTKVISSFGGKAVVRCDPDDQQAVSKIITTNYPGSTSLITSGTLRKIREIYPELKVQQKRKHPRRFQKILLVPLL